MPGGLEVTPRDELTELPLPVLATSADFYFKGVEVQANYHHHFHPERSPELGYDERGIKLPRRTIERIEGSAVRYSRGQYLPMSLHNRYHAVFFGPELPTDSRSKFTAVVLACAGVVPRNAIDLSEPGGFEVVDLSDRQHDFIRRRIYFEGAALSAKRSKKNDIGKFLAEYTLQSALADVVGEREVKKKISQFLKPKSDQQRSEAGRFILSHAIDTAVADLIPVHNEAAKELMIRKPKKDLGKVVLKYFAEDRFPDYFNPLEDRLLATFC